MKYLLLFLTVYCYSGAIAQEKLYISKSTGQFTQFSGSYSKTTDNFESGNFSLSTEGPIKVTVDPADLYISPNQTKSWNGAIIPDTANAPAEGQSAPAALKYEGDIRYSRPFDAYLSPGQVIESVYSCSKCPSHPEGGLHQVVNEKGSGRFEFVVFTLGVTIEGPDYGYKGSKLKLVAKGAPEGGTYEWKSLSGSILVVEDEGANATATFNTKDGTGKGIVQVKYTVEGKVYTAKKVLTFFILKPKMSKDSICDGESPTVTLKTDPGNVPPAEVKKCISNLKIFAKPFVKGEDNPKVANIIGHTNINFPAPDDTLTSTADVAYWFISKKKLHGKNEIIDCSDKTIYTGIYDVWAEADNDFSENKVVTNTVKFGVKNDFKNCVNGHATILPVKPNLDLNLYTFAGVDAANMIVNITQPAGPLPVLNIVLVKSGTKQENKKSVRAFKMKTSFEIGNLTFTKIEKGNIAKTKSQFYDLIEWEENRHTEQFKGDTKILALKDLLSLETEIRQANDNIKSSGEFTLAELEANNGTVIKAYARECWEILMKKLEPKIIRLNETNKKWDAIVRCPLEREAKEAMKDTLKIPIYTLDMPCAYPTCTLGGK